jgi:phosphatidylglycerophosphate synthase
MIGCYSWCRYYSCTPAPYQQARWDASCANSNAHGFPTPSLPVQAPAWVNYYAAAAIFIYQTLDALDGKQARRTGTGSCLGELFDHGCDAFTTVMVVCLLPIGYWPCGAGQGGCGLAP